MILPLALLVNLATAGVYAQSSEPSVVTLTYGAFPTGTLPGDSWLQGIAPLVCDVGCFVEAGPYPPCFINQTLEDGTRQNQTFCDAHFCDPTRFHAFSQCLNCILANGGERPFGIPIDQPFDLSTASPPSYPPDVPHVPGWIGADTANAMLKNVSDRCASIGRALTTDLTVTATATTTGPYNATWKSGETRRMPQWTGLSGYAIPTVTTTVTWDEALESSPTVAPSSMSASASGGSPAGASAPSSTTSRSGASWAVGIPPVAMVAVSLAAALASVLVV